MCAYNAIARCTGDLLPADSMGRPIQVCKLLNGRELQVLCVDYASLIPTSLVDIRGHARELRGWRETLTLCDNVLRHIVTFC
jgi:hypothetical protein